MTDSTSEPTDRGGPWYARFFKRDYLQYYGHTLGEDRTEHEAQFIIKALGLRPSHSVLDLCCGQGRHSVALAKTGIAVTGVDLSEEMLSLARDNATAAGVEVDLIQADMRRLPEALQGKFDAVVNLFSSFGYLESEADDQQVLHQVAGCLKPGGTVLMDLLNREWVIINNEPYEWRIEDDGTAILEHRDLDLHASVNHLTFTEISPDGTRSAGSELHMRLYTLTELTKMLANAGMSVERVYGGFDGQEYTVDTRRMIVIAKRGDG